MTDAAQTVKYGSFRNAALKYIARDWLVSPSPLEG
jgi:hypothetical protein